MTKPTKEVSQKYYKKNRGERLAYQKEYNEKNKAKIKEIRAKAK